MNREDFYSYLETNYNFYLTADQKEKLQKFADILIDYNKHTNITSITDMEGIYLKHFYDSLSLLKALDISDNFDILDVGSGGGFPGLVLAIAFPKVKITLLDSNHKKSDFQRFVVQKLGLKNVEIVTDRAENFFNTGNKYDVVVSRAVANLTILTELCLPLTKKGGTFISMKGDATNELNEAEYAIKFLGGCIKDKIFFNLPISDDNRTLIVIEKNNLTPKGYPRSYDKILKKSLKNPKK